MLYGERNLVHTVAANQGIRKKSKKIFSTKITVYYRTQTHVCIFAVPVLYFKCIFNILCYKIGL